MAFPIWALLKAFSLLSTGFRKALAWRVARPVFLVVFGLSVAATGRLCIEDLRAEEYGLFAVSFLFFGITVNGLARTVLVMCGRPDVRPWRALVAPSYSRLVHVINGIPTLSVWQILGVAAVIMATVAPVWMIAPEVAASAVLGIIAVIVVIMVVGGLAAEHGVDRQGVTVGKSERQRFRHYR